jgi:hypothetical protein
VKDKLPRGEYIILVSLWDRVAGNVLAYRKIRNIPKWRRFTHSKPHNGKVYDEIRPTMVYTFELFQKKNALVDHHRVMAYGTFPLCDSTFDIAQGKFKVPMLRGEVDRSIDKFADIENLYKTNIDEWLCNLYFSVEKLD